MSLRFTASLTLILGLSPLLLSADELIDPTVLVQQLGADDFADREAAGKALLQSGNDARDALRAGVESEDPEIRIRSVRILEQIERLDLRSRLLAFVADEEGKTDHKLPYWDRFRKLIGQDKTARGLFVEMFQEEPELMNLAQNDPHAAGERFQMRGAELQLNLHGTYREKVTLGSTAALLFIGGDPLVTIPDQATLPVFQFINQPEFQQAINSGPMMGFARSLLGGWIETRSESIALHQNMYLAMRYDLKEALNPALALIEKGADPNQIHIAILAVGKLGGREHIQRLEPALKNRAVCSAFQINNKTIQTEVRDVALAVLVHLTGQSHKEYGFDRLQTNPQILYNVHTLGFSDPARREEALKKWLQWVEDHPATAEKKSP